MPKKKCIQYILKIYKSIKMEQFPDKESQDKYYKE